MILSITTFSIMKLSIMTLSTMTLSITTFSIMKLSVMTLSKMTVSINDNHQNNIQISVAKQSDSLHLLSYLMSLYWMTWRLSVGQAWARCWLLFRLSIMINVFLKWQLRWKNYTELFSLVALLKVQSVSSPFCAVNHRTVFEKSGACIINMLRS